MCTETHHILYTQYTPTHTGSKYTYLFSTIQLSVSLLDKYTHTHLPLLSRLLRDIRVSCENCISNRKQKTVSPAAEPIPWLCAVPRVTLLQARQQHCQVLITRSAMWLLSMHTHVHTLNTTSASGLITL